MSREGEGGYIPPEARGDQKGNFGARLQEMRQALGDRGGLIKFWKDSGPAGVEKVITTVTEALSRLEMYAAAHPGDNEQKRAEKMLDQLAQAVSAGKYNTLPDFRGWDTRTREHIAREVIEEIDLVQEKTYPKVEF